MSAHEASVQRSASQRHVIKVESGEETRFDLDLGPTGGDLIVALDIQENAAQETWVVLKIQAALQAAKLGDIVPFVNPKQGGFEMNMVQPEISNITRFRDVSAGTYTLCVLSSVFFGKPLAEFQDLPATCAIVRVAEGIEEQTVHLVTP